MNNANWQVLKKGQFIQLVPQQLQLGTWHVGAVSVCFLLSVLLFYSKIVEVQQ